MNPEDQNQMSDDQNQDSGAMAPMSDEGQNEEQSEVPSESGEESSNEGSEGDSSMM